MGHDGIHPKVLIELADVIVGPLSIIFQRFGESGEVSVEWKVINVPVLKQTKEEDPATYRPVTPTSVSVKILEKVI